MILNLQKMNDSSEELSIKTHKYNSNKIPLIFNISVYTSIEFINEFFSFNISSMDKKVSVL